MFDTKVHHRDPKTAKVVKVNPYRMVVNQFGTTYFRGGKQFYADGTLKHDPEAVVMKPKMVAKAEEPKPEAPVEVPSAPAVEEPKAPAPVEAPEAEEKLQSKGKKAK